MKLFADGPGTQGIPPVASIGEKETIQALFAFTPEQVAAFKVPGTQIVAGITHAKYGHMAILPEESRAALAEDFA